MGWNQNTVQAKALQYFWTDRAKVLVTEKVKDPDTGITDFKRVPKYTDIPCKLSFSSTQPADQENVAQVSQQIKLFLSKGYKLSPGCEIEINRDGTLFRYRMSGIPEVFSSHQEISLKAEEKP